MLGQKYIRLVIDSRFRDNYLTTSSTNYKITLPNPVAYNILAYSLDSACIPKTSYNVQNADLRIRDSSSKQTITITPGNYSISQLTTTIETLLNDLAVDTYTVTFSSITMKLTITSSWSGFELNPDSEDYLFMNVIGFNNFTVYPSTSGVLTSINVVDLSGIKNVYILISEILTRIIDTQNRTSNFKVDYSCPYGSIIYFDNQNKYIQQYETLRDYIENTKELNVRLVDEYGNDVDLNGSDWSFVLTLFVN